MKYLHLKNWLISLFVAGEFQSLVAYLMGIEGMRHSTEWYDHGQVYVQGY